MLVPAVHSHFYVYTCICVLLLKNECVIQAKARRMKYTEAAIRSCYQTTKHAKERSHKHDIPKNWNEMKNNNNNTNSNSNSINNIMKREKKRREKQLNSNRLIRSIQENAFVCIQMNATSTANWLQNRRAQVQSV